MSDTILSEKERGYLIGDDAPKPISLRDCKVLGSMDSGCIELYLDSGHFPECMADLICNNLKGEGSRHSKAYIRDTKPDDQIVRALRNGGFDTRGIYEGIRRCLWKNGLYLGDRKWYSPPENLAVLIEFCAESVESV